MNNALLYIKSKFNGEIPYKYGSNECAKLMSDYATFYHENEIKKSNIINWISCDDKLPDNNHGVYLVLDEIGQYDIAYYYDNEWHCVNWNKFTHWVVINTPSNLIKKEKIIKK